MALFPYNDPGQLPVIPLRKPNGEWLRLEIALPGCSVWLRTWQVQVGRVKLYLLDSNDLANFPPYRGITSELYGGASEMRIKQEMVLGIGGWMLLEALDIQPEVVHLNEGHAAFAVLERARSCMQKTGQPFDVALTVTRAGNLFTTHTAVAAGFDHFSPALMQEYLGAYAEKKLGIPMSELLALGRQNPADESEYFNMAYLAIRGSGGVNGVSRLHGQVSLHLFKPLFPRWPPAEVPIGHITNGVHVPTWDAEAADALWTEACGKDRWRGTMETLAQAILQVSDIRLWQMRTTVRESQGQYVRQRLARQLAVSGASELAVNAAQQRFDPQVLTLGFARRFVPYKRPDLLLYDQDRLLRLLNNPQRPVQLIIAGKASPFDPQGNDLIKRWNQFIQRPEASAHVVFLSDYDVLLAEHLVEGIDVWLNTPQRPWEASGTSGMKVLVNGGLNLSELDGWWAEAYTPEVGWALGDGKEHGADPAWNAAEAEALYQLLEQEVIPAFYTRDTNHLPTEWIAKVRKSMATLTPAYSSNRTVREYTEHYYLAAAQAHRERAEDFGALGKQINDWKHALKRQWPALHLGEMKVKTLEQQHAFEVPVYLGDLDSNTFMIELYAEGILGGEPAIQRMYRIPGNPSPWAIYQASVPATRPASDYTVRIIPYYPGVSVPLETNQILWQR